MKKLHYFSTSLACWHTDENLLTCVEKQKQADKALRLYSINGFWLYKIPLEITTDYEIEDYVPQVENKELIDFVEYPKKK